MTLPVRRSRTTLPERADKRGYVLAVEDAAPVKRRKTGAWKGDGHLIRQPLPMKPVGNRQFHPAGAATFPSEGKVWLGAARVSGLRVIRL